MTVATTLSQIYIKYMSWKDTSVSVSRIDAIWDKDRRVYVSQWTDWPRPGANTDVFTCLNGQTGHDLWPRQTCLRVSMDRLATKLLSNRPPPWCTERLTLAKPFSKYVLLHIETYLEPRIPKLNNILTLHGIFTKRKICLKLSHINDMGKTAME